MIAGVRTRTLVAIPRRAWRVLTAKSPSKTLESAPTAKRFGYFESFERMMSHRADQIIRNLND